MSDNYFYVVLKFRRGELDTTDSSSSYRYKPGARMYPTKQPAGGMRRRWLGEGYDVRIARVWVDADGPHIEYCDEDDRIAPVCGATGTRSSRSLYSRPHSIKCVLDAGHSGWHSTTRKPTPGSEFQADPS
ncbi:hypothetical protein SEA_SCOOBYDOOBYDOO_193 [Mycobacterium phage ScoobyDoobyDoo]|nr:hypothetical protein SEA_SCOOBYDOOBYDOO_193 [Mycobacterium phage ScoobyDoobyDoo]